MGKACRDFYECSSRTATTRSTRLAMPTISSHVVSKTSTQSQCCTRTSSLGWRRHDYSRRFAETALRPCPPRPGLLAQPECVGLSPPKSIHFLAFLLSEVRGCTRAMVLLRLPQHVPHLLYLSCTCLNLRRTLLVIPFA